MSLVYTVVPSLDSCYFVFCFDCIDFSAFTADCEPVCFEIFDFFISDIDFASACAVVHDTLLYDSSIDEDAYDTVDVCVYIVMVGLPQGAEFVFFVFAVEFDKVV